MRANELKDLKVIPTVLLALRLTMGPVSPRDPVGGYLATSRILRRAAGGGERANDRQGIVLSHRSPVALDDYIVPSERDLRTSTCFERASEVLQRGRLAERISAYVKASEDAAKSTCGCHSWCDFRPRERKDRGHRRKRVRLRRR